VRDHAFGNILLDAGFGKHRAIGAPQRDLRSAGFRDRGRYLPDAAVKK
jgi:hypothetical protein